MYSPHPSFWNHGYATGCSRLYFPVFDVECDVKSDESNRPGTIEGSDLEIRCNVRFPNGISPPVMQWFRNGVKISPAIMETYHLFGSTRLKTGLLKVLLRANATDDGSLFSCRVAFNSSKADEFVYYWNFTAIVWRKTNLSI